MGSIVTIWFDTLTMIHILSLSKEGVRSRSPRTPKWVRQVLTLCNTSRCSTHSCAAARQLSTLRELPPPIRVRGQPELCVVCNII